MTFTDDDLHSKESILRFVSANWMILRVNWTKKREIGFTFQNLKTLRARESLCVPIHVGIAVSESLTASGKNRSLCP